MKCLLLALTGMGNDVLNACLDHPDVESVLVVTRVESGAFPYYSCENLAETCSREGVECLEGASLKDPDVLFAIEGFSPDIVISATFHQIVPQSILALPPKGAFNVHPSLLPAYKGPMPTNWAIIHGELQTGVTIHEMTLGVDEGRVALQRKVDIGGSDDGGLRRIMYSVAGELTKEFLDRVMSGSISFEPQRGVASRHPRVLSPKGLELLRTGGFDPANIRRGVTPWPGVRALDDALASAHLNM
jgi:methionyl-tRNA formyltransferase